MMVTAVVAAAILPGGVFAPPLDRPVQQQQAEIRDDGRSRRTFKLTRRLQFGSDPGGFVVAVTTLSADAEADASERARYRLANSGLLGRKILIHLDPVGRLRSVDDLDAVWLAWTAGLVGAQTAGKGGAAEKLIKRLSAMSAAERTAMIGAVATSVVADQNARTASPSRAITIASPPPFGDVALTGTTATNDVDGRMVTRTTVSGSTPAGSARIAMTVVRTVDPATGLIVGATKRVTISSPRGALTTETTETLSW